MFKLRHSKHTAKRNRPFHLCVAALAALAWSGGCAQLELTLPPLPDASTDQAVLDSEYPELEPVQERPRFGYELEQAREIQTGLLSDRDNARYTGDAIRYETGQLAEPPPLPATLRPLPATSGPGELIASEAQEISAAEAAIEERLAVQDNEIETDETTLEDFLDRLSFGAAETETPSETVPVVVANIDNEPAAPQAQPAEIIPVPTPLEIEFAGSTAVLPNDRVIAIGELAERLAADDLGARIVANANDTGLAIDRARAIAVRLVARGVSGSAIDIETGGSGDVVVIYPEGSAR